MSPPDVDAPRLATRSLAARALAALVGALVVYACWRGYQSPDFLLGVGAAFGLC